MVIVMVVNAVLAALVFAVVVGSLVRNISAEQPDHASLALRLRSPHRGQRAPFVRKDVLRA
jgi:hypothetical protein